MTDDTLTDSTLAQVAEEASEEAARAARLRYAGDEEPGYIRRRRGKGFTYRDCKGSTVTDTKLRRRFAALAIPPAWTEVWISRNPNGHLQTTGRDDAGRKQYIYHPRWHEARDRSKFDRVIAFGHVLPKIRARVDSDLELDGLPRDKVLGAVVSLLETTLARVGNAEYARNNDSYGLTTLRKRHVDVDGGGKTGLALEFEGKGGKPWRVEVDDPRVVEVIGGCLETPGYELFKYIDDDGVRRDVTSDDVNGYLREVSGADITAKDFRTWAASVLAGTALAEVETASSAKETDRQVVEVVKQVAEQLGNTPAICRQAYIHPEILDGFAGNGELRLDPTSRRPTGLDHEEAAVLAYLEACSARDSAG